MNSLSLFVTTILVVINTSLAFVVPQQNYGDGRRPLFQKKTFVTTLKSLFAIVNTGEDISTPTCKEYSIHDSFNLVVLGDLHMEDDMSSHEQGREDCITVLTDISLIPCPSVETSLPGEAIDSGENGLTVDEILNELKNIPAEKLTECQLEILLARKKQGRLINSNLVSVGDLGRKDIRHEPGDAGTTKSFLDAKIFFDGFGLPYNLITGNHDLEGLDEFDTDEENLQAWKDCFQTDSPHFSRQISERTLLVGLSTVRFRDSPHSSHECHVDDAQLEWFENVIQSHPHKEGWRIIVVTHAPVMGSGLRVLQNVHVMNGCAWMNHCSEKNRSLFIENVKENPQIKLWFSGHFHLSHDYEDSISRVNQCTFVQVGVMGPNSSRDGRRQTRIIQGNSEIFKIYTLSHHKRDEITGKAELRLDAKVDLKSGKMECLHENVDHDRENWFSAYVPEEKDGCYLATPEGKIASEQSVSSVVCWWHMSDGAVLGVHEGQLVEYDSSTLSPLGIVVNQEGLDGKEVFVVDNSSAVVLINTATETIEVVHPNDDGSYWRKYQRNKRVRLEEKAREAAAKLWLARKQQA